jgi:hypothetical protein
VKPFLLWLLLTVIAVAAGFVLAMIVSLALNAILPPFRFPEDDDSMREFIPAAITYATWATTTVLGSAVAWRWTRRRPDDL